MLLHKLCTLLWIEDVRILNVEELRYVHRCSWMLRIEQGMIVVDGEGSLMCLHSLCDSAGLPLELRHACLHVRLGDGHLP